MKEFNHFRIDESVSKRVEIDSRDEKILSMLSENSRLTPSAIADKIHLSKEGTFYRIKSLENKSEPKAR